MLDFFLSIKFYLSFRKRKAFYSQVSNLLKGNPYCQLGKWSWSTVPLDFVFPSIILVKDEKAYELGFALYLHRNVNQTRKAIEACRAAKIPCLVLTLKDYTDQELMLKIKSVWGSGFELM